MKQTNKPQTLFKTLTREQELGLDLIKKTKCKDCIKDLIKCVYIGLNPQIRNNHIIPVNLNTIKMKGGLKK